MKTFLFVLVAFLAYVAAVPASKSSRIDLYRNTLQGYSSGRVVGGENAKRHQFPYQVSIIWSLMGMFRRHLCGGSLISKKWILTAGHCKLFPIGDYEVRLGQLNQNENHEDIQEFKIVQFIIHPEYLGGITPHDIALIELDREAELTEAVQIVKLAKEEECNSITNSVLSGWGLTDSSTSELPKILQWATLPQCADDLAALEFPGILDESMICTGTYPETEQGACSGDSGGPLVLENGGSQIGVVSWGYSPCGTIDAPSEFTRVCSHYDFIYEHVKE